MVAVEPDDAQSPDRFHLDVSFPFTLACLMRGCAGLAVADKRFFEKVAVEDECKKNNNSTFLGFFF